MTKVIFHGHAFLELENNNKSILIDPFINWNTECDTSVDTIKHLNIPAIILTHGHADHIWDTIEITKKTWALVIAEFQLIKYLEDKYKLKNTHAMNIWWEFNFGSFSVKLFQAIHGWGIWSKKPYENTGIAASVLLRFKDKTIFHAGDTALTKDFALLWEYENIDYAFLPIWDNFTMWPKDASIAANMIKPKIVVPIHYNTREVIQQDPQIFQSLLANTTIQTEILKPGEYIEFSK